MADNYCIIYWLTIFFFLMLMIPFIFPAVHEMLISLKPTEYRTVTYSQHTRHVYLWLRLKYLALLK